ncbi:hypothetical protein CCR85_07065 [Rhodothalassium salexigens]|nr:hypothetical protein [Rhodothalassium salexigens]
MCGDQRAHRRLAGAVGFGDRVEIAHTRLIVHMDRRAEMGQDGRSGRFGKTPGKLFQTRPVDRIGHGVAPRRAESLRALASRRGCHHMAGKGEQAMADKTDILVIGGGIAGASAAYYLADAGARVTVVESEALPGYHTTGRSAAFFAESYGGPSVLPLTSASRGFFEQPPAGFSDAPLVHDRGALHVFTEDQVDRAQARLADLAGAVSGVDMIDAAEVRRRVPVVALDGLAGAIDDPDCWDMDVAALHQGFLGGLRARGGAVRVKAPVEALDRVRGVWRARVGGETVEAAQVVNAAGAWGDRVAELAGVRPVGLIPCRRTIIVFNPAQATVEPHWPLVFDLAESFYFRPESGGVLASPADETAMPAGDVQPEELDVAIIADRIQRATTLDVPSIRQRWAGLRTFAPDRAPVIGFDPDRPGFFWSVGQAGWGIQTAPAWGRLVADLVLTGAVSDELAAFGVRADAYTPRRFAEAA